MRLLFKLVGFFALIFVAIIGLLYATNSSVKCPAFDEKLASWFPYSKGETLTFVSRANQLSEKVFFDSLRIQHKISYDSEVKCGTCGDLVEAVFMLGKDTLSVSVDKGDPMFANTSVTNLNGLYPIGIQEQSANMLLSWSDSANPSGITQILFREKQGLIWFKRGKQKFYCIEKDSSFHYNVGQAAFADIIGCQ